MNQRSDLFRLDLQLDENFIRGNWTCRDGKLEYDGQVDQELCEKGEKSRQEYLEKSRDFLKKSGDPNLDLPSPSKVTVPSVPLLRTKRELSQS